MIVRKEKVSTKIKNYFKNIFSKMLNNAKKNKKKKGNNLRKEYVVEPRKVESQPTEHIISQRKNSEFIEKTKSNKSKEITVEFVGNKRKPKEITIEYENKTPKKKKEIVVEYENRKRANAIPKENSNIQAKKNSTTPKHQPINNKQVNRNNNNQKKDFSNKAKNNQVKPKNHLDNVKKEQIYETSNTKNHNKEEKIQTKKDGIEVKKPIIEKVEAKPEIKEKKVVTELALKPTKIKKEKKIFNIFQLFKEKERKKRKEILNRVRENKMDDYETISTKTKLSRGSIAVEDVDANELDPLIDLYRDSNKKLRNRIRESQNF